VHVRVGLPLPLEPALAALMWFLCPCCPDVLPECDPRLHYFGTCPIALAVREAILVPLAAVSACPIQRASYWVCTPRPSSVMNVYVCGIICLAALSAIHHGRRQLWRLATSARGAASPGPLQATMY